MYNRILFGFKKDGDSENYLSFGAEYGNFELKSNHTLLKRYSEEKPINGRLYRA